MRYFPHLLGLILVLLAVIAQPAFADQRHHQDEPATMERIEVQLELAQPWEQGWWQQPRGFWRRLAGAHGGRMDAQAMRFLRNVRTIAILPFADLTSPTYEGSPALERAGGPRRIAENLAAELMTHGFLVIPPADAEAMLTLYSHADDWVLESEAANNSWYLRTLADMTISYSLEKVIGLSEQLGQLGGPPAFLTSEDIGSLAEALGADCVIRGFVYEYAVSSDIDADLRTFIPPFLGLINPDRRATLQVAYYIYNGQTGDLLWNGTVDVQEDAEWPVFTSESELLRDTESGVVVGLTDRLFPSWEDLVMGHPGWVPSERLHDFRAWCNGEWMEDPDWLNPMRQGWHTEYRRHAFRFEQEPVEDEVYKYDGLIHNYNGIRHHPGGSPEE